jgi:hypothetical protein
MQDDMSDVAPALLMTVIIAIGIVGYQFRAERIEASPQANVVKADKSKSQQLAATNDRLYWIR